MRPFTDKQIELLTTFADQAVIAIENVRLFDEVQARTRELTESLEQQTATSEVLSVISSSPGELEPVFETMLANATRLCEASYGLMYLCEGDAFRMAALHGDLPGAFKEQWRCGTLFRPHPDVAPARACEPARSSMLPTCVKIGPISAVIRCQLPESRLPASAHGRRPDAEGERADWRHLDLPQGGPSVHRQADRAGHELRGQAVIAIENTRLLNELRESLQQQTATADVLKVISRSTFELQPVLRHAG